MEETHGTLARGSAPPSPSPPSGHRAWLYAASTPSAPRPQLQAPAASKGVKIPLRGSIKKRIPRGNLAHAAGSNRRRRQGSAKPPTPQTLSPPTSLRAWLYAPSAPSTVMELTKQASEPSPPKSLPVKPSVHKEPPPKAHPQMLESVRLKFRDDLAAALSIMDSGQQSPGNVASAGENSGGRMQGMTGAHKDDDDDDVSQIGLLSKRRTTTNAATDKKREVRIRKAQSLASKIEEELFKLFGGSKKYMEKGTSLVFNLEDRHNPVLREQVLSGQISPKWLCAMTVEELAKMCLLPDIQVDDRLLAGKTRKGEFQVEVEEETDDVFPVQAGPGGDSLPYVPSEPIIAVQTKSDGKTSAHCREIKELDSNTVQAAGVVGTWNTNTSNDLEYLASDINDLVLKPRYDDLNRPKMVSFSDFLRIVASEPHSKHQPVGAMLQDDRNSNKAEKINSAIFPKTTNTAAVSEFQIHSEDVPSPRGYCESKLESPINKPASVLDPMEEPKGDVLAKSSPQMVDAEESRTVNGLPPESNMQCEITPDVALTHDTIWEATIQHESSRTNIVAIFRSGGKPSTREWRRFIEIEGPVRLSALKKILIELPKSRSRTIMVTELRWKEGSLESGRHNLLKNIDSYIADDTVGLVKPAQGITLYLCPSQGKAAQILADHLPKEHLHSLTMSRTSIIGVVVWQRPHASSKVPSRQDGSKRQATGSSSSPMISKPSTRSSNPFHHKVPAVDVPLGVGSGVVRHQDGLPAEYNLVSVSNSAADVTRAQSYKSHQEEIIHMYGDGYGDESIEEMIRKYGDGDGDEPIEEMIRKYGDDNGDDIPHSQGNFQQERIQQPRYPYQQYYQQLQHHSMRQYHMARNSQSPLAYTQHQHTAMPVRARPLIYGHPIQPAQQSYSGVPDDGSRTHVALAGYPR